MLSRDARGAVIGTSSRPLVELIEKPGAPPASPRATGLYHFALLVPERADLAAFLRSAVSAGYRIDGAADHWVSEAVYLSDPDGHGIEVYWDRPRAQWRWDGASVRMAVETLDVSGLMALSPEPRRLPSGTTLGHVHLRVADVAVAERFYTDTFGLSVTAHLPGASFVAADGYHHHFGLNSWSSRGGAPAPENSARLERVRLRHGGVAAGQVVDPSGNVLECV